MGLCVFPTLEYRGREAKHRQRGDAVLQRRSKCNKYHWRFCALCAPCSLQSRSPHASISEAAHGSDRNSCSISG